MDDRDASFPPRPDLSAGVWASRPSVLDLTVERPTDARVLAAASAAAVATDLALRSGGLGAAGALLVVVVSGGMLATGRVRNPQAVALVGAAPLFGLWLMVRTSPWVVPLDATAAGGLLAVGASLASGGSVLDLTPVRLVVRAEHAMAHALAGPAFLLAPAAASRRAGRRARPFPSRGVARGVVVAVPLLVVLGVLLGSADPVFASWFHVPADPVDLVAHGVLLALGAWGMAALLRVASATPANAPRIELPGFRGAEPLVVLAGLDALFGAFAAAQVVAASGGAHRVLETRGLTYAEYARSGFFQLVAVAVITLLVLLALRAVADPRSRRARGVFLGLALAAIGLTLVVVGVALHRMQLYERAFGLTMLRLYVQVAMLGIGALFAALAVRLAGVGASRPWLTPVSIALALAVVLGLDLTNPEAVVARHDIAFAARTGPVDVGYLAGLSDDAVPTLVRESSRLPEAERRAMRRLLCARPRRERYGGWAAWNASRDGARTALATFCSPSGRSG